jgi:aromatic ring-cleaving dioxygenase
MFTAAHFENIVPWLMLNRQGLDVLVHGGVARLSGAAEAQHDAPRLPRRAVSDEALSGLRRLKYL